MIASTSASTTKTSITSGNSAHSSGWLNPASTSTQPGATTAKFHSPNIHWPSRALVTRPPGEQRHRVIEKREERVAEPAQHDALRVVVAQTAPAQPRRVSGQIRNQQFDRRQDAEVTEISSVTMAANPCA